jgi:GNAT superfamily N-acetyltransferase
MAAAIADRNIYSLVDESEIRGFVEFSDAELVALFVDPDHHGKGFGSALLEFATQRIEKRPAFLKSSLNAVSFYQEHGWSRGATECFRRHEHDIYVVHMELT